MEIAISEMIAADYDEVIAFWRLQPGIGLNESDDREAMVAYLRRNPGMSFVTRDEGRIIAAVLGGHDGRRGCLHHLAVAERYRGRGIARGLVRLCLRRLVEAGIAKCNVFVYADNVAGERFWTGAGFGVRADLKLLQRVTKGEDSSLL